MLPRVSPVFVRVINSLCEVLKIENFKFKTRANFQVIEIICFEFGMVFDSESNCHQNGVRMTLT